MPALISDSTRQVLTYVQKLLRFLTVAIFIGMLSLKLVFTNRGVANSLVSKLIMVAILSSTLRFSERVLMNNTQEFWKAAKEDSFATIIFLLYLFTNKKFNSVYSLPIFIRAFAYTLSDLYQLQVIMKMRKFITSNQVVTYTKESFRIMSLFELIISFWGILYSVVHVAFSNSTRTLLNIPVLLWFVVHRYNSNRVQHVRQQIDYLDSQISKVAKRFSVSPLYDRIRIMSSKINKSLKL